MASQQPAAVRELIRQFESNLPDGSLSAYTGSFHPNQNITSAATFIPALNVERLWIFPEGAGIFTAEVTAITKTLIIIYEMEQYFEQVFIFSDSMSAIQTLSSSSFSSTSCCLEAI